MKILKQLMKSNDFTILPKGRKMLKSSNGLKKASCYQLQTGLRLRISVSFTTCLNCNCSIYRNEFGLVRNSSKITGVNYRRSLTVHEMKIQCLH